MTDLQITSYPSETKAQIAAFLTKIHPEGTGKHINFLYRDFSDPYSIEKRIGGVPGTAHEIIGSVLDRIPLAGCHNLVHSFNPFKNKKVSGISLSNLNKIDTIALSFITKKSGNEQVFIDHLLKFCDANDLPMPNAFSLTGNGDVDIFYCIGNNSGKILKGVRVLGELIAYRLDPALSELDQIGVHYKTKMSTFKFNGSVRLPGTMDPRSRTMCQFFTTNAEEYTYQGLFELIHSERFGGKTGTKSQKVDLSQVIGHASSVSVRNDSVGRMIQTRIDGLLQLARTCNLKPYSVDALFIMANCCRGRYFTQSQTKKKMRELAEIIGVEVSDKKLNKILKSDLHKFKTETIAEKLGMSINDEAFIEAFHVKGKYKKPQPKKLNNSQIKKAELYIAVAKELVYCNQAAWLISARTGHSIDRVKKCCVDLRKGLDLITKWSRTTLDDIDFILEQFGRKTAVPKKEKTKEEEEKKCAEKCEAENPIFTTRAKGVFCFEGGSWISPAKKALPSETKRSANCINLQYSVCVMENKPSVKRLPRTPFLLPPILIEAILTGKRPSEFSGQSILTKVPNIYEAMYYYCRDMRVKYTSCRKELMEAYKRHDSTRTNELTAECNTYAHKISSAVAQYNAQIELIKTCQPQFREFNPVKVCIEYAKAKKLAEAAKPKPKLTKAQKAAHRLRVDYGRELGRQMTYYRIVSGWISAPKEVAEHAGYEHYMYTLQMQYCKETNSYR